MSITLFSALEEISSPEFLKAASLQRDMIFFTEFLRRKELKEHVPSITKKDIDPICENLQRTIFRNQEILNKTYRRYEEICPDIAIRVFNILMNHTYNLSQDIPTIIKRLQNNLDEMDPLYHVPPSIFDNLFPEVYRSRENQFS